MRKRAEGSRGDTLWLESVVAKVDFYGFGMRKKAWAPKRERRSCWRIRARHCRGRQRDRKRAVFYGPVQCGEVVTNHRVQRCLLRVPTRVCCSDIAHRRRSARAVPRSSSVIPKAYRLTALARPPTRAAWCGPEKRSPNVSIQSSVVRRLLHSASSACDSAALSDPPSPAFAPAAAERSEH
jgi:hypothetical protein